MMNDKMEEYSDKNKDTGAKYVIISAGVGIIVNVFLFIIKLIIGILSASISITADATNNLSDAGSSLIALIGVKLANRPADKKHPFGHGRLEYIAALIISIIIIQVGLSFLKESIFKIIKPTSINVNIFVLLILGISVIFKLCLYLFNKKLYNKKKSYIIKAVSVDCLSDAVITSIITVPVILNYFGFSFKIDGVMGFFVAVMVLKTGVELAKDTITPLLGTSATKEEYNSLRDMIAAYDGILGTHDLIIHHYGEHYKMATIHVEVDKYADMETVHNMIDKIERDVKRKSGIFLVIHMDPIETQDEEVFKLKERVETLIKNIDSLLSIHDFRLIKTSENIHLYFDLLIPYEYNEVKETELVNSISENIKEINAKYECFIHVDKSFVDT